MFVRGGKGWMEAVVGEFFHEGMREGSNGGWDARGREMGRERVGSSLAEDLWGPSRGDTVGPNLPPKRTLRFRPRGLRYLLGN